MKEERCDLTIRTSENHNLQHVLASEGSDVYLECRVKSRPNTDHIVWMKDVSSYSISSNFGIFPDSTFKTLVVPLKSGV